jgi:predicted nucleic acid-binding protein
MKLLDTNVISEPERQAPNARVIDWIDAQALETLYLSAITVAELRAGIALMPVGKCRDGLHENLEKRLLPMFVRQSGAVVRYGLHEGICRTAGQVPSCRLGRRNG